MDWLNIQSVDELKKLGKFREVKTKVQSDLSKSIQIKARGWKDLFRVISKLKTLSPSTQNPSETGETDNPYFKSEAARYIYALVELSGESQLREMSLSRIHFRDPTKAKSLRNRIAHEIHPDKCHHPKAVEAMDQLTKLFKEVLK